MKKLIALFFILPICRSENYRKEGDFIIAAVLPLTNSDQGKCTDKANAEGITICEGIINAVNRIASDDDFRTLLSTTTIGYDIRDSCSNANIEKKHLYLMNLEQLAHSHNPSNAKPVDIVLSAFTKDSIGSLDLLNIESVPQMSYSMDNVRLTKDDSIKDDSIERLVSIFPENTMKVKAIADLIKDFGYEYVYSVYSNDFQSRQGGQLLKSELAKNKVCSSDDIVISDESGVKKAILAIASNPSIKVVVVQCTKKTELELYKQLAAAKMTSLMILSTGEWYDNSESLKPHASVLQGMIFIENKKQDFNFKTVLEQISAPYSKWVQKLYDTLNQDASEVTLQLSKNSNVANYAFNGVYAIVNALKKKKANGSLLAQFNKLNFNNPLTLEKIVFTDHLTTVKSTFTIYNIHGNSISSFEVLNLGKWGAQLQPKMQIQNSGLEFKDGSKVKPLSVCSEACQRGFQRFYKDSSCCWECKKCPSGKTSNITNADMCLSCGAGEVANLDQTACLKYKVETFQWFKGIGAFLIFLMVLGICLSLFALGILSQNREHEVVKNTGYKLLLCYTLACLIMFLTPVPLLITPTSMSCSSYIAVFNLATSIAFGVLFARSQFINGHFDEDGRLTKTSCSSYPREVTLVVVVLIQVLIMVIGLTVDPPLTLYNDTDRWDVRYFECSSWASFVFWIGFGYNISLSIVVNFFSCTSTKMEENCEELKYSLITVCVYYCLALAEIIIFYRAVDAALAGAQGVMCVMFGCCFYFCFLWPKIFVILFRSKADGRTIKETPLLEEDEVHVTTAIHASSGFKGRGVVQMKIKEESFDKV